MQNITAYLILVTEYRFIGSTKVYFNTVSGNAAIRNLFLKDCAYTDEKDLSLFLDSFSKGILL
jgi:hypothetical protein